jgi:hypothetical protein
LALIVFSVPIAVAVQAQRGSVTYHGGPVQHMQKIFTIFWDPASSFPGGYQSAINQFVQDLSGTPYYAIASQYGDGSGNISTVVAYGGTWLDTVNALPESALTRADLLAEVNRAKSVNGWTSDANSYFMIYTPSGYASSDGPACGLHWFGNPAVGQIMFPDSGCFAPSPWPNNEIADAAFNASAHEIIEAATDPQGNAWYSAFSGGELADLCNFSFGRRSSDGSNVTFNGHNYLVQQLWSNAASGCALTYGPPVVITRQPQSLTITSGQMVTLSVAASGTAPFAYQWYVGASGNSSSPIAGATSSSYNTGVLTSTTSFWVSVSNAGGSAASNAALAIVSTPPAITLSPASETARVGQTVQFAVGASGDPAPGYQWQVSANLGASWVNLTDGAPYSGATTATLTVTGVPLSLNHAQYRGIAINNAGVATSGAASLTVVSQPFTEDDFDHDRKSDLALYRPATGYWYIKQSSTNYTTYSAYQWGVSTDIPVPGDYDGDGQADLALYRPSTGSWYILLSTTNYTTYIAQQWGLSTDMPLPGDYDGDGKADLALYRPSTGYWYVLLSSANYTTYAAQQWGLSTDVPLPGDYDGDGKADLAVYRPSTGWWYILQSSTADGTYIAHAWGLSNDMPAPGDYDGDGKTDLALYRPSTGVWYILQSSTGYSTYLSYQWGVDTDIPVPGDYDGDGKTDPALYRPSAGIWYVLQSSTNYATYIAEQWGSSTDKPIPSRQ